MAHKMLKPIIPSELSSSQAYQFKIVYNLDDDEWKDLTFEQVQVIIQEMKDSILAPMVQDTSPSIFALTSTQLEEEVQEFQHQPKRSIH